VPWALSDSRKDCAGWAVFNQATGALVKCHRTKAEATAHLKALYANAAPGEAGRFLAGDQSLGRMEERASGIDTSPWDGNRAMTECKTASDYAKVCAGEVAGDPGLRSSHKLPHHFLASYPDPNVGGVQAALQRFSSTQNLTNAAEARAHLEAHMKVIQGAQGNNRDTEDRPSPFGVRFMEGGYEVRDQGERASPLMVGHFTPFNEWTEVDSFFDGHFMERVHPGALQDSLAQRTPKVTLNHGKDPTLGKKVIGMPRVVREDSTGGYYEVELFRSLDPLVVEGLRAGAYGSSFTFLSEAEDYVRAPGPSDHNPKGLPERTILKAQVPEFGPVTFNQYEGATAALRFTDDFIFGQLTHGEGLRRFHEYVQRTSANSVEDKPPEDKPRPPGPESIRRFTSREEYLAWINSQT